MRRILSVGLVLLQVISAMAVAQQIEQPPAVPPPAPAKPADATEGRPLSTSTAILRVECDPESGLATAELVESILRSSKFMKNVDAQPDQGATSYWNMTVTSLQTQPNLVPAVPAMPLRIPSALPAGIYMARVEVVSFNPKRLAEDYIKGVRAELEGEIAAMYRIDEKSARLSDLKFETADKIAAKDKRLQLLGLNRDEQSEREEAARLAAEAAATHVRMNGLEAREKALREQIAKVGADVASKVQDDPIVDELQKVVLLREGRLSKVREAAKKGGGITEWNVDEELETLSKAKAELEKSRRAAMQAAGGARLAQLQENLDNTLIQIAEEHRKLEILDAVLEDRPRNDSSTQRLELELLEDQYRQVLAELNRLRLKQELLSPRVTVVPVE